mgnify:CR=1 FL=1
MKKNIHSLIYPILLFAGFSIALPPFFKSLSLVLLLLVLLVNRVVNKNQTYFSKILNFKNPVLYLAVFYFLYCIGMFYTADLKAGFDDLMIKLPLLLLPIAICFLPQNTITKHRLWKLFLAFLIGLLVMQVYCLTKALFNAFADDVFCMKEILYINLAKKYHPTYLSMFTSFSLLFLYRMPSKYMAKSSKKAMILKLAIMLLLSLFNVLLNSRIGIIAMFLAFVVILLNEVAIRKKIVNALAYLCVSVVFVISFVYVNEISNRFSSAVEEVQKPEEKDGKVLASGHLRGFIFGNVVELIKRNPIFGAGTGDVRSEMEDFYLEKGVKFSSYLNPHNQFIQTVVAIGLIGGLCFIVMLFVFSLPFWNKEGLIFLFSIGMLCVYMMTESIIERQQGVHFVAFYLVWLSAFKGIKKEM